MHGFHDGTSTVAAFHGDVGSRNPVVRCLAEVHARYRDESGGAVATYIPELAKADPDHFGIVVATVDGAVYEVGDARARFTIQSISKPFVYGLALEDNGPETVFRHVGVEPSGDVFNAIVFDQRGNRPFNPMVNAGAIAATALIKGGSREGRLSRILSLLGRFAGRPLDLDDAVFLSEKATGHRNRAIAYLELGGGIIDEPIADHLDLYFQQCSVLVDARDLAVMAATLANRGVNPLTGETALSPDSVRRMLSVMQSCGMYDFSGEWSLRVGMPAKSGVGGGIIAVLPGQMGIGVFSPPLDDRGNSVRGIRVCEDLSRYFDLHMFDADATVSRIIRRSLSGAAVRSKRSRSAGERAILDRLGKRIRIIELQGDLYFGTMEQICRTVSEEVRHASFVILDGRRVGKADYPARTLMTDLERLVRDRDGRLLFAGFPAAVEAYLGLTGDEDAAADGGLLTALAFPAVDEALEWCESRLIEGSAPGSVGMAETLPLRCLEIAAGLSDDELAVFETVAETCRYAAGAPILREGDEADGVFMLASGSAVVRVAVGDQDRSKRLGSIGPGAIFGEIALFDGGRRTADVVAETESVCYRLPVAGLKALSAGHPAIYGKLLLNVGRSLAGRLRQANAEIRALEG